MKSTKRKEVIMNKDGTFFKNSQNWTEESLTKYREYQTKYIKEEYRTFIFRARKDSDAKLIKYCEEQENFASTVNSLIKSKMMKEGILPNDQFMPDKKFRLQVTVTFQFKSKDIQAEELVSFIKKVPQKNLSYNYQFKSAYNNFFTIVLNYDPDYSMTGVIADVGQAIELFLMKKCEKILSNYMFNPHDSLLEKEYKIEEQYSVAMLSTEN